LEKIEASEVKKTLSDYHKNKRDDVDRLNEQLDLFLEQEGRIAKVKWSLNKPINPRAHYSLKEIKELMPQVISPKSNINSQILKAFKKWGIDFVATPTSKTQNKYHISGQEILDFINKQVSFRENNINDSDLLFIIHGKIIAREKSQDKIFGAYRKKITGGAALAYTMTKNYNGGVRTPACFSKEDAKTVINYFAGGAFDSSKYIDFKSFKELLPEILKYDLSTYLSKYGKLPKGLRHIDKQYFYQKVSTEAKAYSYKSTHGYLLEQSSIFDYLLQR